MTWGARGWTVDDPNFVLRSAAVENAIAKSPLPLLNDEPVRANPKTAGGQPFQIARIKRRISGDDDHARTVAMMRRA